MWRRGSCSKEGGWVGRLGPQRGPNCSSCPLLWVHLCASAPRLHRKNWRLRPARRAMHPGRLLLWRNFGLSWAEGIKPKVMRHSGPPLT